MRGDARDLLNWLSSPGSWDLPLCKPGGKFWGYPIAAG